MKVKKKILGLSGLSVLALLSACSDPTPDPNEPSVYDGAIRTEVSQQLADSASRSTNALETLAMIRKTKSPAITAPVDETALSPDLQRTVTTTWSGPGNSLVKQLATNLGYTYLETGGSNKDPNIVNIDVHDVAIGKVLEDVGLQVAPSASIIVNPNVKRIEFRNTLNYQNPNSGAGSHGSFGHKVLKRKTRVIKGHPPIRHGNPSHVPTSSVSGAEMPSNMVPVN